jgi:1-acyl-sn-glycerol-3-phosphate acyltransferase
LTIRELFLNYLLISALILMEVRNINSRKIDAQEFGSQVSSALLRALRRIHTAYGLTVFALLFLLFLPLLTIPIAFRTRYALIGVVNRWWAKSMFFLVGLPFRVEYRFKPAAHRQYIFCPNHFSYLDIPTVGLNRHNTIFVGKSEMSRIPLFGLMYRKLHITVDRSKLKSRYTTMVRSREAIDEGKSLTIFPEGGIATREPPQLAPFKDGAFRLAIEKQIPIVPVTIPGNWIILPDNEFLLHWGRVVVIFHEPVDTRGLRLEDVGELKKKVSETIRNELSKYDRK